MRIKSIFITRKGSYDVSEKLPGKYKLYEERWWMVAALGLSITLNLLHFNAFPMVSKYAAQYYKQVQSKSFNSVCRNISALVGCIKKLRALYEVHFLEIYKIPQLNLIYSALSLGNVKKDRLYAGPFWTFPRESAL